MLVWGIIIFIGIIVLSGLLLFAGINLSSTPSELKANVLFEYSESLIIKQNTQIIIN